MPSSGQAKRIRFRVRAGDVLVSVNGRRVRRLSEYATARGLRKDVLELVVVRDGRTLTLWAGIHGTTAGKAPPRADNDAALRNLMVQSLGARA